MNLRKFFLYLLIVSVVASALIGIGVILFREFGELETRILLTTFTITVASILGLACGANLELKRGRILPIVGIFFSITGAFLCMVMIWKAESDAITLGKLTLTAVMIATLCAHLSLISMAWLDTRFKWSYYVVMAADFILTAILLIILWFEPESSGDMTARIIGVLSIVIAALTIMTPVFHKLSVKPESGNELENIDAEIATLRGRIEELERRKAALA